ncbi:MAG: hypothetical protein CMF11_06505 [Idiomarina sp.]|nr:hypothetical protein [Idiomarina sp.]
MLAGQAGQGLMTGIAGIQQSRAAARQQREGEARYAKQLADFRKGKFDQRMSGEVGKAAQAAKNIAAEQTKFARERGEGMQQALLGGVGRSGDFRGFAAVAPQAQQLEDSLRQAELSAGAQMSDADRYLADTSQEIASANQQLRQQLEAMELARGAAQMDAGTLARQQGIQASMEGFGALGVQGGLAGAGIAGKFGRHGMKVGGPEGSFDFAKEFSTEDYSGVKPTSGRYGRGPSFSSGNNDDNNDDKNEERDRLLSIFSDKNEDDVRRERMLMAAEAMREATAASRAFAENIGSMEEGGYVGEEGGVTEGEFSHETNPIDMINKEGEKVGEVTGGEVVLNPEQATTMQELVNSGEAEMLLRFMQDLLSQPQFQD